MKQIFRSVKNIYHLFQAIFATAYFGNPARNLHVIGVTGTDGKTTTSTLIYHILKSADYRVALISTVAAYIGDEQIDTGFHVTSPSSWQLQKLMAKIAKSGFTHIVLESTSHGLDQHRLHGANIKTAVITNITHEHLDYHLTYEGYVKAKSKIFNTAKVAIINADDNSFGNLLKLVSKTIDLIPYSLKENTAPSLVTDDTYHQLTSTIIKCFKESYNQQNALAASYASLSVGVSLEDVIHALPKFNGVPGRMQHIDNHLGLNLIVDFAHTPNALHQALTAAKKATKGKLIVVFGSAGKRDKSKRPLMGKEASLIADEIILTAEDPRGEDVRVINSQIKSGALSNRGHVHSIVDRTEAIKFGLNLAKANDTLIICGKGHEQSMNLDGQTEIPWSDAKVLTQITHQFQSELK